MKNNRKHESEAMALGIGLAIGAGLLFVAVETLPVLLAGCGIYIVVKNLGNKAAKK